MKHSPPAERFTGLVHRAHNPRWSYAPTSGEGAARHGGRFNRRGLPALYTALDPKTAWMEAQQGMPFKAQPLTLVAYALDCAPVADLTDPSALAAAGIDAADLACPWEDLASRGLEPPSWRLADDLIAAGFHGAIVPSVAPGTRMDTGVEFAAEPESPARIVSNLVLWAWSDRPPCCIRVVDDFARLPKDDRSWR